MGAGLQPGRDRQRLEVEGVSRAEGDAPQDAVRGVDRGHLTIHHRDGACRQLFPFLVGGLQRVVEEQGDFRRPLAEQQGLMHGQRTRAQHPDPLPADFPAVTVGTVHHALAPLLPEPFDRGQLVGQAGGNQKPSPRNPAPVVGHHVETVGGAPGRDRLAVDQRAPVGKHFPPAGGQQLAGPDPVPGEEPVHARRRRIAGCTGINDHHRAQRPGQGGGGAKAGRAAAHNHNVTSRVFHTAEPLDLSLNLPAAAGGA